MMYTYKGFQIVLGDFGWAVYSGSARLGCFDTDTDAERFIDNLS